MSRTAYTGARIFDGHDWHDDATLVIDGESVAGIMPAASASAAAARVDLDGGLLVPGFVDLQVNGGGGVMFNGRQDADAIRAICAAHVPFGTTALLATLITDTPEITGAAIAAGAQAARESVPGFLGLHLEGPHLSKSRKGAHDPTLIRPMADEDQAVLIAARQDVQVLLTTVAVESVSPERIRALADAGIIVSLGHTDATHTGALAAAEAGASMVTHLFNAMSQLGNREPGLVGAAINIGSLSAGLIADGIHVDPVSIGVALRAKQGPGKVFLVTDAMATIGTDLTSFMLNGRTIHRAGGRLTLADGTLAGADLDMISAVRFMHRTVGLDLGEALRMAALYPALAVRQDKLGHLRAGAAASFVHLSDELDIRKVWIDGRTAFTA